MLLYNDLLTVDSLDKHTPDTEVMEHLADKCTCTMNSVFFLSESRNVKFVWHAVERMREPIGDSL